QGKGRPLMAKVNQTKSNTKSSGPKFLDSGAFDRRSYVHTWLVEDILVGGQPAVLGGPRKSLKSTLAIDLALSIGSGTRFLGAFPVPRSCRVAVLSGESGAARRGTGGRAPGRGHAPDALPGDDGRRAGL